jgi:hypothetical protein
VPQCGGGVVACVCTKRVPLPFCIRHWPGSFIADANLVAEIALQIPHCTLCYVMLCYVMLCYVMLRTLCLTKHHSMKTYWGVEVYLHALLTSALDGGEWSASCPGRFTPRERVPGTHWIGGSVSHYTHTDPYPSKIQHNITEYREKYLKTGDVGFAKPHVHCTSNVKGTVLSS